MTLKSRPISVIHPEDYLCGLGSWRPQWLQRLATPRAFLFIFGIIGVLQGAAFTYMIASITTLEKRYSFGSKVSGLILIADNVMELITNPLFGYLANRVHRPRMIGFCQIIVVLGCYLAALPYFIYGPGLKLIGKQTNTNETMEFCDSNRFDDSDCDLSPNNTIIPAVVILWLASCCNGIGFTAFYIIGFPYIDDNVKKKNSPLYLSTTTALRLCGPTLGFMLSSFVLRYYENPLIDPGISDIKDPRWIGAWWIGFIFLGTGILIFTIPMFFFPRHFKTSADYRNKSYLSNDKLAVVSEKTNIWLSTKRIVKNPIFCCYTLGTTLRLFGALGYFTFKSKYIESEYKKSASSANFFSGIIGVVPSAIGIFLGGVFIRQYKPGPKLLTILITVVELVGFSGILAALFLGCPASQFAGVQYSSHFEMQKMCNDNCYCSTRIFSPICGSDGKTNYFSPCFANCKPESFDKYSSNSKNFSNCNCFDGLATEGYCKDDCNTFPIYVTFLGICNIIGNLAKTGNSIIAMRIVDKKDKSFSLGLAGGFMCIFAFIPYPLVFGAVTDAACLVWETYCGQRGNCWIYDPDKFRYYLHGTALLLLISGSVFDVLVVLLSSRIKNLYSDEVEDKSTINLRLTPGPERRLTTEFGIRSEPLLVANGNET